MSKEARPQFRVVRDNIDDTWVVEGLGYGLVKFALSAPFSSPELGRLS